MESKHKLILGLFGIGCLTFLETVNLIFFGIDGGVLAGVCAGIGSIIGVIVGKKVKK